MGLENTQLKSKDSLKHISAILQGGEGFPADIDKKVDETLDFVALENEDIQNYEANGNRPLAKIRIRDI